MNKVVVTLLKILVILVLSISLILFSAALLLQDKVEAMLLKSVNKNISTKLDLGPVKLSFLKRFPKGSLEIRNLVVHSSTAFNSLQFHGINTDTLLAARLVSIEFKITDIIRGVYSVERAGIRAGVVNLFTDTSGSVNYKITFTNSNPGKGDFNLELKSINLTDIKANYNNLAEKLIIKGLIRDGRFRSRISGENLEFGAKADMIINKFRLNSAEINRQADTELDIDLISSKTGVQFKKGTLRVEKNDFGLSGTISSDNFLDLTLTGQNIDVSEAFKYLPENILNIAVEYKPSGILFLESKIKGVLNHASNPHIELNCSLNNGHIASDKSDMNIDDLTFRALYSNGSKNVTETSSLTIADLEGRLGSSVYTGSFVLTHFNQPYIDLAIKGRIFPQEIKEFFNLDDISSDAGSADFNLKASGTISRRNKFTLSAFIDMKPEVYLHFDSLNLGFKNNKILLENINGDMMISESVIADKFRLEYKDMNIKIDGEFYNLPEWFLGRPVLMSASADVEFSKFNPELLDTGTDKSRQGNASFALPPDILLDLNFKADSLVYKSFSASDITGTLNYKPGIITFTSLSFNALDGIISGNGYIAQNASKAIIASGKFIISEIDVNKTFYTFHNFGQDFIKSENITGILSGSLSLLLPMDSMMKPQIKSVTAEGKYLLVNGGLHNFDPVRQLSSFIELSELENINFEKMQNDFFIRNNYLYIPQMDVKSTAVDLSVNGKHGFDNNFEYHVKVLLSEILSKKRKRKANNLSEFGMVEDDGLGRTSMLLKIEDRGADIKVGYDIKAVANDIKNNIKSERQNLKSILNQEYGWYKSDTVIKAVPAGKPRFRITWEENNDEGQTQEKPETKGESHPGNIFRK